MGRSGFWVTAASAVVAAAPTHAHHSYLEFDQQATVEIEGRLVAAAWQNPHTSLRVATADGKTWDIETSPINSLRRANAPLELYAVGSNVKVAGWPSRRAESRLYGTNILSAKGEELVLFRAAPRWSAAAFGTERQTLAPAASVPSARTLFRVWGSAYARPGVADDPDASPGSLSRVPWPFTDAARNALARFDAVQYNMTMGCTPKGMPIIMNVPAPLDFVDRGDAILLRLEEFDTVRTIHMNAAADPAAQPPTRVGYSAGRWEGDTLVVRTGSLGDTFLVPGVPLGPSATFVETFTPSADGSRLHYTLRVTDPQSLLQPVEQKRSWVAVNERVMPFNCTTTNN